MKTAIIDEEWEAVNHREINRRGTIACDWIWKGQEVMHERSSNAFIPKLIKTPAQLFSLAFKELKSTYWTHPTYTNLKLAEKEAKKYGGEVIEHFYCDPENPAWFIAFDDFDKAALFIINFEPQT